MPSGIKIIDRQTAVSRVGRIRMGERKKPNRPGFQRDTFRFTSANKAALEMLQQTYGGKLTKWDEVPGEWELDSEAGQISVIVDTTLSVDDWFEQYDGKTRTHFCDGVNCELFEIKRDRNQKITFQKDHGTVPCMCDEEGYGPDPDNPSHCQWKTVLRVMLPATGDIMLWEFQSKGKIFNKEVRGAVDQFRAMGIRHGYCHLSINRLEKIRGNEVSKFGVARLTLDPNPPNFVASLLARTPEAQAKALLMGEGASAAAPSLPNAAPQLPQSAGPSKGAPAEDKKPNARERAKAIVEKHGLTADQFKEIGTRAGLEAEPYIDFLEKAHADGHVGHAALLLITGSTEPSTVEDPDAYLLKVMEIPGLVDEFKSAAGEQWREKAKAAQAAGADSYATLMEFASKELVAQEQLL